MTTKSDIVIVLVLGLAVTAQLFTSGCKSRAPSAGTEPSFQSATNIIFTEFGSLESKQFAVSDPPEIARFVAVIRLVPKSPTKRQRTYGAEFQRPSGWTRVFFRQDSFDAVDSRDGDYKPRSYRMPKEFYAEFRTVAQQHGWHVEANE